MDHKLDPAIAGFSRRNLLAGAAALSVPRPAWAHSTNRSPPSCPFLPAAASMR
jgi:hypothetical protein